MAYELRISDWSSDVCSSDLRAIVAAEEGLQRGIGEHGAAARRHHLPGLWHGGEDRRAEAAAPRPVPRRRRAHGEAQRATGDEEEQAQQRKAFPCPWLDRFSGKLAANA